MISPELIVCEGTPREIKVPEMKETGLRKSSYVMCSRPAGSHQAVICHGYTGAIDIVPERIVQIFRESPVEVTWDTRVLLKEPLTTARWDQILTHRAWDSLRESDISYLQSRGYLTEMTEEAERRYVALLVERIHRYYTQHLAILIAPYMDCNLRCAYCFQREIQKEIGRAPDAPIASLMTQERVDTIFEILRQQRDSGVQVRKDITLYGGEALQSATRDIVEHIVTKGKGLGYCFKAISNGFELDRFLDLLGPSGIEHVQVTIDGPEESHNAKRPGRHGERTYVGILSNVLRALQETEVQFEIGINIDSKNIDNLTLLLETFRKNGLIDHPRVAIHANEVYSVKTGKSAFEDNYDSIRATREKAAEYGVMLSNATGNLRRLLLKRIADRQPLPLKPIYCSAVTGMFIFAPDGAIYSCWEAIGETTGRVGRYFPEFELDTESYDRWINRVSSRIDECHQCEYIMFCGGGCTMNSYRRNGKFLTPYCDSFQSKFSDLLTHVGKQWIRNQSSDSLIALNSVFPIYEPGEISDETIMRFIGAADVQEVKVRESENWLCNFH